MYITRICIKNFKGFEDFQLDLNPGMNIIVGDNEAKKTTILEAINLVLSGNIDGKYLTPETLNDYLFNKKVVDDYKEEIENGKTPIPPSIIIDLYFSDDASSDYEGIENVLSLKAKGIYCKIGLRQEYEEEYRKLKSEDLKSLPLELYSVELKSFSGNDHARTLLPIKNSFIDTSSNFQNASDQTVSRIIKNDLDTQERIKVSQFYRTIKDSYKTHPIYTELSKHTDHKDATISIDPSSKNSWDSHLSIYVKDIPFPYIGKGLQTIIKTNVSLSSNKTKSSNIVLIEEPENHLSHTTLNELIDLIGKKSADKQVIITSHSSFIANKLGLENLILLNNNKSLPFRDLKTETIKFFKKLPGYDTLRLLLCKKALLVEGDADELIVQRAYLDINEKLPISNGIDVISVNNTYERFFQLAKPLEKKVALLIDVDSKIDLRNELNEELKAFNNIDVFFEENDPKVEYNYITINGEKIILNKNTLEPLIVKYNGYEVLNKIFNTTHSNDLEMVKYMTNHKTECALAIFESETNIIYPKYILDAIKFVS